MILPKFGPFIDNFGKFIHQFQLETKTLIRKLEKILIRLYRQNLSLLFNETCLNERLLPNYTHTHTHTYIYIFTNLLSTSIHSYQEKRKKNRQEQKIKISRITARGKKEKYHRTKKKKKKKKKRPTPSHQLKKIKRYAVNWSKEK